MPERMNDFFAARVDGYDTHMLTNIEGMEGLSGGCAAAARWHLHLA